MRITIKKTIVLMFVLVQGLSGQTKNVLIPYLGKIQENEKRIGAVCPRGDMAIPTYIYRWCYRRNRL